MKNKILILALCILLSLGAAAQSSIENSRIRVVGVGSVTAFPNAATISLSLRFVMPRLRDAIDENQKTARDVLAVIRKYVKDTNEIKVSLISTDKAFRYDNVKKKDVLVGFESSQTIIFTLTNLNRMQDFTEEILKTRIYAIDNVSYFNTEAANYMKKAQEMAVADAKEITDRLAKAAGVKAGKIVFLQTGNSPSDAINNTVDTYRFETYNKSMGGRGVSSSGQLITYTANVTLTTAIE